MKKDAIEKLAAYFDALPAAYTVYPAILIKADDCPPLVLVEPKPEDYVKYNLKASVLGHGPAAGLPKKRGEPWTRYLERVFGVYVPSPEFTQGFVHWEDTITAEEAATNLRSILK